MQDMNVYNIVYDILKTNIKHNINMPINHGFILQNRQTRQRNSMQ